MDSKSTKIDRQQIVPSRVESWFVVGHGADVLGLGEDEDEGDVGGERDDLGVEEAVGRTGVWKKMEITFSPNSKNKASISDGRL